MIQIDMPMPTNCLNCPACNEYLTCAIPVNGRKWGENNVREFSQNRPEWCPLKEQEAQDAKEQISDAIHETAKQFRQTIVRCKDCKHWEQSNGHCPFNSIFTNADWFCADGEEEGW